MTNSPDEMTGPNWGQFPPKERQEELQRRLQAWEQESDHKERSGPFAKFELTGADVFWLAARVAGEGDMAAGRAAVTRRHPVPGFFIVELSNLHLEGAILVDAQLQGANLYKAQLRDANLYSAQLQGAGLYDAQLQGACLVGAQLQGANLNASDLRQAQLQETKLDGDTQLFNVCLNDQVQVADIAWNGVPLMLVDWDQVPRLGDEAEARQGAMEDLRTSKQRPKTPDERLESYQTAIRAYRQLAVVLRGQGITEPVDRFTYRALIMQRKALWWQIRSGKVGKLGAWLFSLFLAALTGYGFRLWRIILAYALIVLAFATAYWSLGFQSPPGLNYWQSVIVSVTAFHGRVFANPFTLNEPQIAVTAIEAIFGLVIESIFIAMLTQRFFNR